MRNKIIAFGLAFAVVFAVACGAGQEPVVTGTGQGGRPANATGQAGPKKLTVGTTANLKLASGATADVTVGAVKVQGKYLVAPVTVACTGGTMSYNTFDWSMLAGDGTKLDRGFAPEVKNELSSGDLGTGQKVTGNVVFQGTAEQAKGAQVVYEVGFSTVAYWVNP